MEYRHGETLKKTYVAPEDFADLLSREQLQAILAHQNSAFQANTFIAEPLPQIEDESIRTVYQTLAENREIYEGGIDDAIQEDEIIRALLPKNRKNITPEIARAIRARSSAIAAQCVLMPIHVQVHEIPTDYDRDSVSDVA
ncbi:hypothetical protein BH23PAT2_BH23PAT2_00550 [soil metagenome]